MLVFYRGGSCGYCSLQLRARHQRADDLARLGATLLAISPQTPDHSLRPAEDNQFTFTVLSDSNLEAANGPARLVREGQHREALCMATGGDFPSLR